MVVGPQTAEGLIRSRQRRVPWAPPAHLMWRATWKKWGANPAPPGAPYYGPKWPKDDPFTYKSSADYSRYVPYKGGTALPTDEKDWRSLLYEPQYTSRWSAHYRQQKFGTRVEAGVETRSPLDQSNYLRTKPRHQLEKPLQLQLKQMKDANDAWRAASLKEKGTAPAPQLWDEGEDPFMYPTLQRRDYSDRSVHTAGVRQEAMRIFRKMAPDRDFRVSVETIRALGQHRRATHATDPLAVSRTTSVARAGGLGSYSPVVDGGGRQLPLQGRALDDWLSSNATDGRVSFDAFVRLFTEGQGEYYKLAGHDVPGEQELTGSRLHPLGVSHTGITGYESRGRWAHGS